MARSHWLGILVIAAVLLGGPPCAGVELADQGGGAQADSTMVPNGRIVVRVVGPGAQKPKETAVELIGADTLDQSYPRLHYPSRGPDVPQSGEMEWAQLPPGRYVLGVNITRPPTPERPYLPTFYPGVHDAAAATIIQIGRAERVELEPFRLPDPQPLLFIRGTVVWPTSRVAAGAHVRILGAEPLARGRSVASTRTDRKGEFAIQAVAGVRYRVAVVHEDIRVESRPFELTPATAPILMVLRR